MRSLLLSAFLLAAPLPALAQAPSADAAKPAAKVVEVKITGFAFAPGTITVPVGTTVKWTNADDDGHTVVSDAKGFRSPPLDTGESYSFTFTTAGTYPYHCGLHPQMIGKVVVTKE